MNGRDTFIQIVLIIIAIISSALFGAKGENQRILTKCLEHSSTLPYYEAAKQCKEMVE